MRPADLMAPQSRLDALYKDLKPLSLAPLWASLEQLVTREPDTGLEAALWRFQDIRPLLIRAGDAITTEEAVRRVLILENPAAPGLASITTTIYAGLQLLLPGEVAPAHRHTQSAFRFIVEGGCAFTTVDGERFEMSVGDLVLTPSLRWHDHGNPGDVPVIWLDGLDIPLVRSFAASFAETFERSQQLPNRRPGTNRALHARGLKPFDAIAGSQARVVRFHYPHAEWRPALHDAWQVAGCVSPDGVVLEFTNPVDGGPVLPTMSAFCTLLPSGFQSTWRRRTDGVVYCVTEGRVAVTVGDRNFEASERDIFVVPAWQRYRLQVLGRAESTLFSYSDRAAQAALGLWRTVQG